MLIICVLHIISNVTVTSFKEKFNDVADKILVNDEHCGNILSRFNFLAFFAKSSVNLLDIINLTLMLIERTKSDKTEEFPDYDLSHLDIFLLTFQLWFL